MGISDAEIEAARVENERRTQVLGELQTGDLNSLQPAYAYEGTSDNTSTVLQGEGQFLSPEGDTNGMHTFGAGPCLVMVTVARDDDGNVARVGMSHIDAVTPESSINQFLGQARDGAENLEVVIVSGESETAMTVYDAVENSGAEVTFANIDRDGSRSDAVTVDREGNIYYGPRMDLVDIDPQEMSATALMRQMGNAPLRFEELP